MSTVSIRMALAVLALVPPASAAPVQGVHRDTRLGFQLRPPRGWEALPLRVDEAWIVGKYLSDKEDHVVDPHTGWTYDHRPELRILAFLDPEPGPEEDEGDDGEEGEDERRGPKVYRDYKTYMRDNYTQGYFIEEEEVDEDAGVPVTRLLIKAEGKRYVVEKKVVAWVWETDIGDIAVQVEVTADSYKKMRSTIESTLRSFKRIEREESAPEEGVADSPEVDLEALTPAERRQYRIDQQQALWERMTADLPKDWSAKEIDGIPVINHVDDRFAKKVVEQMHAVRGWLEETFPEVGPSEYACPPIVHICKDRDEESAFRRGSGSWGVSGNRLVTHKGDRATSWEWEYISSQTMSCWFRARDPELWLALPTWLRQGLYEVIGASRAKGSKLEFDLGWLEQYRRNYLPRSDEEGPSIRGLMSMSNKEYYSASSRTEARSQLAALTRFFIEARSRKTRQILSDYLGNLKAVLTELEDEEPEGADDAATEEEEEQLLEKRKKWFETRERKILDTTFERTFAGWSDAQWRSLQREFRRSL
jgi:hypothetical protein